MNAIEEFEGVVIRKRIDERITSFETFRKEEAEAEKFANKIIKHNIKELKAGFAELDMEDWEKFYCDLDFLSTWIKRTWMVIEMRDERARSAKHREYVQRMLDKGLKFDRIVIEGATFKVSDGKLEAVLSDDGMDFIDQNYRAGA